MKILRYWYLWLIDLLLTYFISSSVISSFEANDFASQFITIVLVFMIVFLIVRKISKVFAWTEISEKEVPKWVWRAYNRWERRLPTHPYNMTAYFKGKHMVYKVIHGMGEQGQAPILGWYIKRR